MNISEVAAQVGMTPGAIRWYERTGALRPSCRDPNGYRRYDEHDVALLRLVVTLRRLGLRPGDAGRAAASLAGGSVSQELRDMLSRQLAAIARDREALDQLEAGIRDLGDTMDAVIERGRRETTMSDHAPIRVLFLCTGNSARSQIAQALLQQMGGDDFEVESAGTEPRGVHPYAIRVLAESGIDWSGARSKSVQEYVGEPWDYVITVCDRARQACPVFPGQHNAMHWGLDDPAEVDSTDEERLEAFRRTRMELAMRLRPFVTLARRAAGREQPVTLG
jgi:arsenate reductase